MGSLFSELKRRKVFRVTAAYLVGAWAILEFVSVVSPMLRLPDWAGPLVLVLLTIGLVGAVALSWMFEVTADGLRRTEPAAGAGGPAISKFDWALMAASVAIIALVSYQQIFARTGGPGESSVMNAPAGSISIAVLPFVNLSGDPNQEFFSDGMTEEITSALAKVTGLQVVGRTSAFEFKGQNKDLQAIGKALRATHLLEGSVRKSGSRVRITGQLIRADTGTHLWTENYDRELTDIFATQDDIAQAIARALQVPLGLKQGDTLVASRSIIPESYQTYLRAKAVVRLRDGDSSTGAIEMLEEVVERDSQYAPAWALLAQAYTLASGKRIDLNQGSAGEQRGAAEVVLLKAENAARRAIELDDQNANAILGMAVTLHARGKLMEAEVRYKEALKFDGLNPDALDYYSAFLGTVGRLNDAITIRQQLRLLEPLVPAFNFMTARILLANGQNEAALTLAMALPLTRRPHLLAMIYADMGRYREAADAILSAPAGMFAPDVAEAAARLLAAAPASARQDSPYLAQLSFLYLYLGAPERTAENLELGAVTPFNSMHMKGSYAPFRKTERFKALARKHGLVDYWRARGWPDLCRPVGADDFECD